MTHSCEHSLSYEGVTCRFWFFEDGHPVNHKHYLCVGSAVGDGAATLTEITHRPGYQLVVVVYKSLGNIIKERSVDSVHAVAEKLLTVRIASDYQNCASRQDCGFHS